MRGLERFRNLDSDSQRFLDWNRPFPEPVGERGAVDKLLDQEAVSVGFFEAVNDCDVRVVQRSEDLGFALEPSQSLRVLAEEGW